MRSDSGERREEIKGAIRFSDKSEEKTERQLSPRVYYLLALQFPFCVARHYLNAWNRLTMDNNNSYLIKTYMRTYVETTKKVLHLAPG